LLVIYTKIITMHGHLNIKYVEFTLPFRLLQVSSAICAIYLLPASEVKGMFRSLTVIEVLAVVETLATPF
jgi:hypothetical protein